MLTHVSLLTWLLISENGIEEIFMQNCWYFYDIYVGWYKHTN